MKGDHPLESFCYAEDRDTLTGRSLGYRVLSPAQRTRWSAEVETLARRLQATPYPDDWPTADLFCSVLLADDRRLIAVARYGLTDTTPSQRRGGLELWGIIVPRSLRAADAYAVFR